MSTGFSVIPMPMCLSMPCLTRLSEQWGSAISESISRIPIPAYSGISSMILAGKAAELLGENGYSVGNIDATVIAQKPKLLPYIPQMKKNIAAVFGMPEERVNIKATTEESLGFTGRCEGIAAHAVCLIVRESR